MSKYRVEYDFIYTGTDSDMKWHHDYLDNNGAGMTFEEAEKVASDLRGDSVTYNKNVEVVQIAE